MVSLRGLTAALVAACVVFAIFTFSNSTVLVSHAAKDVSPDAAVQQLRESQREQRLRARLLEFPDTLGVVERRVLELERSIDRLRRDKTDFSGATVDHTVASGGATTPTLVPGSTAQAPAAGFPGSVRFRTDQKCGNRVPLLPHGGPVECDPEGSFPCCSDLGWCGATDAHCKCKKCVNYRKRPAGGSLQSPLRTVTANTFPPPLPHRKSTGNTVAVIVPFRDREVHLVKFKQYWRWFAEKGYSPHKVTQWEIYVAEQFDAESFNRGWNFNVGLALASAQTAASPDIATSMGVGFDCAVIQDIDYLPEEGVDYSKCDVPTQLSAEIDRYEWKTPYLQSAGGIVSMRLEHWQKINGFSNDYFGWGGEDDELHHRLRLTNLLYGDCYPFCSKSDPRQGKTGISIKRPPKGAGRFSGKYMHSVNHTKRVTDSSAYNRNIKLLQQIEHNSARWKSDGLSNLAFRVVDYEVDRTDTKELGITYHHVKVRRGRDMYDPREIVIAVPADLCLTFSSSMVRPAYSVATLGKDIPWDLLSLRARAASIRSCADSVKPSSARASFLLVDRRTYLAKVLSDENPRLLTAFYRSLTNPANDGLIVADPRPARELRKAFEAAHAHIAPPTEYSVCTSKLKGGELKYSLSQGPVCSGGWDMVEGGAFWAFPSVRKGMQAVSFCDNTRYWTQRIVGADECEKNWAGLEWSHGGTFWVPEGSDLCVGTRKDKPELSFSKLLVGKACGSRGFEHSFSFGRLTYQHSFQSLTVCIGRKDAVFRVSQEPHCQEDGFSQIARFRARVAPKMPTDTLLCVASGSNGLGALHSDDIRPAGACGAAETFRFAVLGEQMPEDAGGPESRLRICVGPAVHEESGGGRVVGIGTECGSMVRADLDFRVSSPSDVAESTPHGEAGNAPLYDLVEEEVPCLGLFCRNVAHCARSHSSGAPCMLSESKKG